MTFSSTILPSGFHGRWTTAGYMVFFLDPRVGGGAKNSRGLCNITPPEIVVGISKKLLLEKPGEIVLQIWIHPSFTCSHWKTLWDFGEKWCTEVVQTASNFNEMVTYDLQSLATEIVHRLRPLSCNSRTTPRAI